MNRNTDVIDIVIADDHPLFKMGLKEVIAEEESFRIVGDAEDGKEALRLIRDRKPGIAIVDLEMPVMSGIEVIRKISAEKLPVSVIVLTMFDEEETFQQVMDLGAMGYILKDSAAREIVRGIKTVADDEYYISPTLAGKALEKHHILDNSDAEQLDINRLTKSEQVVLKLIGDSKKTNEIAEQLNISPRTVEHHRENICRKLDLSGPYALIRYAYRYRTPLRGIDKSKGKNR
jgi:DNA-binding NarL/FixJ family response regulator